MIQSFSFFIWRLIVAVGFLLLTPRSVFATDPELSVTSALTTGGQFRAEGSVLWTTETDEASTGSPLKNLTAQLAFLQNGQIFPLTLSAQSARIWVLLDTSKLCGALGAASELLSALNEFQKVAAPGTVVSLGTYSKGYFQVLKSEVSTKEAAQTPLSCKGDALASSPDDILVHLNQTIPRDGKSTTVWILTSGNISLLPKTIETLKGRSVRLHYALYNAGLELVLRSLVSEQESQFGKGRVTLSKFLGKEKTLPVPVEMKTTLREAPLGEQAVALQLLDGAGKVVCKTPATIQVSEDAAGWGFWTLAKFVLGLILAAAGIALSVRGYRMYLRRRCHCGRHVRSYHRTCSVCDSLDGAFLAYSTLADAEAPLRSSLARITEPKTFLGPTHRSLVPFPYPKGKRGALMAIERLQSQTGTLFRIHPTPLSTTIPVWVNGSRLNTARTLGHGDEIQSTDMQIHFLLSQKGTRT